MRFPPSVVEAQHGWALSTAPERSERSGEPEWSLRNGGCGDGLPCEAGNEGKGNGLNQEAAWFYCGEAELSAVS